MTGMSKSIKTTQPCYLLESAAMSSLLSAWWWINLEQVFLGQFSEAKDDSTH